MKPRRHVLMYAPPFAALVETRAKACTIRARRFATPRPGDVLDQRAWVGLPCRAGSTQRTMRKDVCTGCSTVIVDGGRKITVGPSTLGKTPADALARRDGFNNAAELVAYFEKNYGLPFCGVLIEWK